LGEDTEIGDGRSRGADTEAEDLAPRRGELIDRYIVLDHIGAGALGLVHSAYDPDLDRRIAIKVLRRGGEREQARMIREAQAIAKVGHPNVVTVHDVGVWRSRVFLAMELVDGESLASWLRAASRSTAEILDALTQAGRGLAAAHAAGIVHRDFKPENVLVGRDGRVRVADFGIAMASRGPAESSDGMTVTRNESLDILLTAPGTPLGTPAYMAPEQHLCIECTEAADQFSFCVALWESLYGTRPFTGDSLAALSVAVLDGKIEAPPDPRDIPRRIRDALERGLATRPEDRHASMNALLDALSPPASTRRRVAWAVALVVGSTAVGFAAARWTDAPAVAACDPAGSPVVEVWRDDVAARVDQAFAATGVAWAATVARSVHDRIDVYADEWTTTWAGYCRAKLDSPPEAARELDARLACLEDRRRELAAAVDVLAAVDQSTVEDATRVLGGLRDIDRCTDDLALRTRRPAPPGDLLVEVSEIRDGIERASALFRAGARPQARALVDALVTRAAATGWPSIEYEVELAVLDTTDVHTFDPERVARLRRAFDRALAVDDGAAAGHLACELGWAHGYLDRMTDLGLEWIGTCEALGEQSGGDWLLEVAALNHRGVFHALRSEDDLAERYFRDALALAAQRDEMGFRVPQLRENFAAFLGNRGLYDRASEEYRAALEAQRALYGDVHPSVADIYVALALADIRRGDFASARTWQERLEAPALVAVSRPVALLTATAGRSEVATAAGDFVAAAAHMQAAVERAEDGDQGTGQRALLRSAYIYLLLQVTPPDGALVDRELARLESDPAVAESPTVRRHLAMVHAVRARTFGDRGQLDDAARRLAEVRDIPQDALLDDRLMYFAEVATNATLRGDDAAASAAIDHVLALDLSTPREVLPEATSLLRLLEVQRSLDGDSDRFTRLLTAAQARVARMRGDDGRFARALDAFRGR
jgi:tetratricopeptide (TPR) repeat protein